VPRALYATLFLALVTAPAGGFSQTGQVKHSSVPGTQNLVPNGDFEAGQQTPDGWQVIDGLSTFWVKDDAAHGKVLKLDSDVLQSQAYEWWAKVLKGARAADAPAKRPTVEPKYDTLAGLDGVWYWSDFIPVEPGKAYWLTLDVKGPGMKVFLRGYTETGPTDFGLDEKAFQGYLREQAGKDSQERGRKILRYRYVWDAWMPAGGSADWKTYSRREKPFEPTKVTPKVRFVRVMIYPYWPPATYFVDNVRLVEWHPPDTPAPK
jgi:hypothetical protein